MQNPQDMLNTQIYLQVTQPTPRTNIMQHWNSEPERNWYIWLHNNEHIHEEHI